MGALLVVAGAGLSVSRDWGAPLASLATASLAVRSAAGLVETGRGLPLLVLAGLTAAACAAIAFRRGASSERIAAPVPIGPTIRRALVATGAVYVGFAAIAWAYHRARGIDAPLGVVVRGADLGALATRVSFYVLTIAAALLALRGTPSASAAWRERGELVLRGVLLFLGTFAILSAAGSLIDLVASLRGTGVGAVAASLRSGLEAETGRAQRGFDPVRIAYVAILAPFGEELLFRWVLFRALRTRLPFVIAALLQAVLFALLHRYRFAAYQTLFIGLASAWAVQRSGRLLPSVVAHGLWNGLQSLG